MKKIGNILSRIVMIVILLPSLSPSLDRPLTREFPFLKDILFSFQADCFMVKILSDPYSSLHQFELSEPNRLVVDLYGIENIKSNRYYQVEYPEIKSIRTGMYKSNIARIVFDFTKDIPDYKISESPEGITVLFPFEKRNRKQKELRPDPSKNQEPQKATKEVTSKIQTTVQKKDIEDLEKKFLEQTRTLTTALQETRSLLEESNAILKEMQEAQKKEEKKFIRIEALGSLYRFSDENLRNQFQTSFMEGAEINIGIGNYVEFWMAFKNYTRVALDPEQGTDRKIRIIPLEAGLKIRFNKGMINPYLGGGLGYHQYQDIHLAEEIKNRQIGIIGQAGFFLKAAENLVFDLYVNYRYCQIESKSGEFDIGGIHFGAGFGFEF
ncbi:MAG: AMIN domain-containing protein [Candidatus Aminicenantes bacterium]|nr:AMIN domain-containing protein [Candidatus Aminicenantes bacterium]